MYKVVIIGGGWSGCAAAVSARKAGAEVTLLEKTDLLMLDDLKPGYDMARAAGVDFAAAGWAYDVPEIEAFMRKNCDSEAARNHAL